MENPGKRAPFFSQQQQTSIKNIERWLKQLRDKNKMEFRGAPKTGGYFVK
jgi:ATP-dependent DNA helicase RecG